MRNWVLLMLLAAGCSAISQAELEATLRSKGYKEVEMYQPAQCPADKPEGAWFTARKDGATHFGFICCELAEGGDCHIQESKCSLCG